MVMAMAMAMAMAMVVTMGKSGRGSSRSSRKCLRLARHRWLAPRIQPAPERTSSRNHAHQRSPSDNGDGNGGDNGEERPGGVSIYTNSRSTAQAAVTGSHTDL